MYIINRNKIEYRNIHIFYAIFHFTYINVALWLLLTGYDELENNLKIFYSIFILTTIFGFTSVMDSYKWASYIELLRLMLSLILINNMIEFEISISTYLILFHVFYFLTLMVSNYL